MSLNEITILILTYNRYSYLERILTYYQRCGVSCHIIVLDSSINKTIKENNLNSLLNQQHITWLKFASDTFISCKIAQGLEKVSTQYSVLCADDDFIIPEGIAQCIDFLNCHQEYISAQGARMIHQLLPHGKVKRSGWAPFRKSIKNQCPEQRLLTLFEKQYASYPYYAVYRKDEQLKIWQEASALRENGFMEILPVALSVIRGKSKILKMAYLSSEANRYTWLTEETFKAMYTDDIVKRYQCIIEKNLQLFISGYTMPEETTNKLFKQFIWKKNQKRLWQRVSRLMTMVIVKIKVLLNPNIYKAAELHQVDRLIKEFNLSDEEIIASRAAYKS